jgi:hypothetical protein
MGKEPSLRIIMHTRDVGSLHYHVATVGNELNLGSLRDLIPADAILRLLLYGASLVPNERLLPFI